MSSKPLTIWIPAVRVGSGADVFALRLERGLRKAGHRPVLQWFDASSEWMPWKLRRIPPPAGTDLVHAGSWQGFAFKREGIPLVVTEHQYIDHPSFKPHRGLAQSLYHYGLIRRCVARSYREADALVAVSHHSADAMGLALEQSIETIHNWVDCEQFAPGPNPARDGLPGRPATTQPPPSALPSTFKLLFVGNPSRWKGADVLPSLAARLGSRFEIQYLGGLRKGKDSFDLGPGITRLDVVPPQDMPKIYRAADAVVVPTRYEAFGYVTLEAMACGRPVIGFSSTGTAEVAVHGETALLAPMDDIAQLSAYAHQLADDAALGTRLGRAGRARALACFDEARGISDHLSLYHRVLAKYRAGAS